MSLYENQYELAEEEQELECEDSPTGFHQWSNVYTDIKTGIKLFHNAYCEICFRPGSLE